MSAAQNQMSALAIKWHKAERMRPLIRLNYQTYKMAKFLTYEVSG